MNPDDTPETGPQVETDADAGTPTPGPAGEFFAHACETVSPLIDKAKNSAKDHPGVVFAALGAAGLFIAGALWRRRG